MLRESSTALLLVCVACGGSDYVHDRPDPRQPDRSSDWLEGREVRETPVVSGGGRRSATVYRNTYYDFPSDAGGDTKASVFDASCAPIAAVSQAFHDKVCLQGSGRLKTGETISFAKRDCACASVCPKSNQKICFEKLDPKRFPSGRGALGQPVTPLQTVAVDDSVIPLGSTLYIPEFEGLAKPGGGRHDGCFLAEDRGSKVGGAHVDIFTGDPSTTAAWNQLVPSNIGVHVEVDAPQCAHLAARPKPPNG